MYVIYQVALERARARAGQAGPHVYIEYRGEGKGMAIYGDQARRVKSQMLPERKETAIPSGIP